MWLVSQKASLSAFSDVSVDHPDTCANTLKASAGKGRVFGCLFIYAARCYNVKRAYPRDMGCTHYLHNEIHPVEDK